MNLVFSRPYDLARHEHTIHRNRKKRVQCPYCREEKTFSRNDALTRHMRVYHPEAAGESFVADNSSDPDPSRGRPLERAPQYSTHSRNSSASSARSMIMSVWDGPTKNALDRPADRRLNRLHLLGNHHRIIQVDKSLTMLLVALPCRWS